MIEKLRNDIGDYQMRKITREELIEKLPFPKESQYHEGRKIVENIIASKNSNDVNFGIWLLWILEENDEHIDLFHKLILEPWHAEYNDIIHDLQRRGHPSSVPVIKIAMQQKYESLEAYSTGTGQFINQCGHALKSIGTKEAIDTIKDLAQNSEDPIIKVEMIYRLSKIFPTNNPEEEDLPRWYDFD